jgi:putative transposase
VGDGNSPAPDFRREAVRLALTSGRTRRSIGVTQFTGYRWHKGFVRLKNDQVKRLKGLEKKNNRLRKAVSDLTLAKLILREAASGTEGPRQRYF